MITITLINGEFDATGFPLASNSPLINRLINETETASDWTCSGFHHKKNKS